jgi:exodeoxyribonuclease V gamma subunit
MSDGAAMYLYRSNRTEALVEALAEVISKPLGSPFMPECIVVQSRGLERWLAMELSKRLGVLANAEFPFPRRITRRVLDAVLTQPPEASDYFEPETLTWAIAKLLPDLARLDPSTPIAHYLDQTRSEIRLVELARRVAGVFDRYIVYRPTWLYEWEQGEGSDWQALLWRMLIAQRGRQHLAARTQAALEILRQPSAQEKLTATLPERISVFAVSSLPPFYLDVFNALSERVKVHLFALSPCREYWADARSARESARNLKGHSPELTDKGASNLTEGHRLLVSLGRLHRGFQLLLEQTAQYQESEQDFYREPGAETMLAALQSDMLSLRSRGPKPGQAPPLRVRPDDQSIAIHSCHSPLREVEVLHDQLLGFFDVEPDLEPHDIVVMASDIELYRPYIDAVFGVESGGVPAIPYAIASSGARSHHPVIEAFLNVLQIVAGRITATEVLDLLTLEPIRGRFKIEPDALTQIRAWVDGSGIRWGVDADHRRSMDQPATAQNTWRLGLERLLLGYAMPEQSRTLFAGRLAYPVFASSSADDLGRFAELCESLFELRERFGQALSISVWHSALLGVLERFVDRNDDNAAEHQFVCHALDEFRARVSAAGYDQPLELDTVYSQLLVSLRDNSPGQRLFSGGVTFCELEPARAVPFRVVYLLGMTEIALAVPRTLSFDRCAQEPMVGDQAERDEMRRLFLEAILSARKRLVISYIGQSICDNAELPASVWVDELLDTLDESFYVAPDTTSSVTTQGSNNPVAKSTSIRDRVIVRHPLQAFSPNYFGSSPDHRLFSYSPTRLVHAKALLGERRETPGFFDGFTPIAETADAFRDGIELGDLIDFFIHPIEWFYRRRLVLSLREKVDTVLDREPAFLDALENWKLGDALLRDTLRGQTTERTYEVARATGQLPLGTLGLCIYRNLKLEIDTLASAAAPWRGQEPLAPLDVSEALKELQLHGSLRGIWPTALLQVTYSRVKAKDELRLWIRHLVLNAARKAGYPAHSALIGRPEKDTSAALITFRPVSDPVLHLNCLIELYRYGHRAPLVFLPEASQAFAATMMENKKETDPLIDAWKKARGAFNNAISPQWSPGADDPYLRHAWGTEEPFERARAFAEREGKPFDQVALDVFEPLLNHRERDL